MGVDRARWLVQSSKLLCGVTSLAGGFDSHAPSPFTNRTSGVAERLRGMEAAPDDHLSSLLRESRYTQGRQAVSVEEGYDDGTSR